MWNFLADFPVKVKGLLTQVPGGQGCGFEPMEPAKIVRRKKPVKGGLAWKWAEILLRDER
jgi:hypothetical protein